MTTQSDVNSFIIGLILGIVTIIDWAWFPVWLITFAFGYWINKTEPTDETGFGMMFCAVIMIFIGLIVAGISWYTGLPVSHVVAPTLTPIATAVGF